MSGSTARGVGPAARPRRERPGPSPRAAMPVRPGASPPPVAPHHAASPSVAGGEGRAPAKPAAPRPGRCRVAPIRPTAIASGSAAAPNEPDPAAPARRAVSGRLAPTDVMPGGIRRQRRGPVRTQPAGGISRPIPECARRAGSARQSAPPARPGPRTRSPERPRRGATRPAASGRSAAGPASPSLAFGSARKQTHGRMAPAATGCCRSGGILP
jgi:translation initiation factor IF-2